MGGGALSLMFAFTFNFTEDVRTFSLFIYYVLLKFQCSTYCDVVCYKGESEGKSIPLPFYLNQQALRLTVKMVGEKKRASYLHSVPCSLLNERSLGQSSGMT